MSITCFIQYKIDPRKQAQFVEYARNWGQAIPACGADLIGYFGPHEGCSQTAYGVYTVDDLAAYERYRARLSQHPLGKENYDFAQREGFLLEEKRIFLRNHSAPHAPLLTEDKL
ncbi:MAG: NIPSNAP family protein [Granulosicoccaceae bacterium]